MYKQPESEPIAIIGSSCRFAGDATSPSKLWNVLSSPEDLSQEVPSNRFNASAFYHQDGEYHGTTNSVKAYWLEQDHRVFDASFFNITPKEAEAIDPQQRLLLEVVYEALESAGLTTAQCSGEDIAVYAGVMTADYDTLSQRDELSASQYYATGNARSIISNRISYFFNFHGPSMTIDTACSSSLVALHQAVLNLRSGESSMACVTGVNLMITPEQFIVESSLHMLSPSGKSRMWDIGADGYARGEGVAALFLKPLSLALADGNEVMGLIRETGVNSDGRTKGITMPNPQAQASLIKNTYRKSGLDPLDPMDRCQYFEAHGTGTQAGDPREAEAIHDAFFGSIDTAETSKKMLVGSIKTIIGHTEGAAGLAGVLKVLQAMKHGSVPPNLHFSSLNPSVKPFYEHLEIPTSLVPWPETPAGQPRRASVNSFGFGGTNSHAIIESYIHDIHDGAARRFARVSETRTSRHDVSPSPGSDYDESRKSPPFLPLFMSAASSKSLKAVVETWKHYLVQHPDISIEKLAWNLYSKRTALPFRVALSVTSRSHAINLFDSLLQNSGSNGEIGLRSKLMDGKPRILGVFTGQGAQWPSMSRSLLLSNSIYRCTIQYLDQVLRTCPDPPSWSLEEQILAETNASRIREAAISQPLCTALQLGLVDLLHSLHVEFHTVVGHSSGEIGAAYAAGRLTARDAILISYYRGLFAHLAGGADGEKGGMLAAGMSESEALGFCRDPIFDGRICVAANNAPSSVTLSGDIGMIELAKDKLTQQNKFARLLQVDTAYHSPHMTRPAIEYVKALQKCAISPIAERNGVDWVSTVHGFNKTGENDIGFGYWRDNMVYTVQFSNAIETALSEHGPFSCALEIGPHPALKGPVTQTVKSALGITIPYSAMLERSKDDALAFSDFLGFLWCHLAPSMVRLGQYIEQLCNCSLADFRLPDMPSYPWDHSQTHYRESRISRQYHFKSAAPHELLGVRTRDDNQFEFRWRNILRLDKVPWLEHHRFQGQALVPASAYCVMALDAARTILDGKPALLVEIQDLDVMSGISLESDTSGTEVLFSLTVLTSPAERHQTSIIEASFSLTSCPADGLTTMRKNMSGTLRIIMGEASVDALPFREQFTLETLPASPEAFYKMMDDTGLVYSGPFRALQSIQRRYRYSSTSLKRRHLEDTTMLSVSPATLDTCLQSAFLSYASPGDKSLWTSFLPTKIESIRFNLAACDQEYYGETDATLVVDSHLMKVCPTTPESKAVFSVDMHIFNQKGEMEIQIEGLSVTSIANTRAEDDYELYLHTVLDMDPTDAIVRPTIDTDSSCDAMLVESCERVAAFYAKSAELSSHMRTWSKPTVAQVPLSILWPAETQETIDRFISHSPYYASLSFIQDVGRVLPDLLPGTVPLVIEEAHVGRQFNEHIGRITRQFAHRYPRMNVLGIAGENANLNEHILSGLGTSFLSYTIGLVGDTSNHRPLSIPKVVEDRVHTTVISLEQDIQSQLAPGALSDLVVVSTSFLDAGNAISILKNIRASMRDGGFLALVQISRKALKERLRHITGSSSSTYNPSTPPEWPDLLEACGFRGVAKDADQLYAPGFSISIRQADYWHLQLLIEPTAAQRGCGPLTDNLLIIGGTEETVHLSQALQDRLSPFCGSIIARRSFEEIDTKLLAECSAAIILADLEGSIVTNMTENILNQFRDLFRPDAIVLWITLDARSGSPEHAATFGFTRTIAAEVPNLKLQILDLERLEDSEKPIAETFIRLVSSEPSAEDTLWVREPEIHIQNGSRMVPRVVPLTKSNDRVNAVRRVVSYPINTIKSRVDIVAYQSNDGSLRYMAEPSEISLTQSTQRDRVSLQVNYSSVEVVKLSPEYSAFVCLGRNLATGEVTVALSTANASYIDVPSSQALKLNDGLADELHFFQHLVRYLAAFAIFNQAQGQQIVLIEGDQLFVNCAREVASAEGGLLTSWTTRQAEKGTDCSRSFNIHPRSSNRELRQIFPLNGAIIYDFLPDGSELSEKILDVLPRDCEYNSRFSLFGSQHFSGEGDFTEVGKIFDIATSMAREKTAVVSEDVKVSNVLAVSQLLSTAGPQSVFDIIDWRSNRNVLQVVKPTIEQQLFDPGKTYVLVGLTRDLGHSLCRLFIEHGARNLVLASRNPNTSPGWKHELAKTHGANISIQKLDVTDLDDVIALKNMLLETMPPVAGVVNGAMVLEDRVFAQMTLENWNRVLRPKTIGSRNLDLAFADSGLDFFIMTSSFAAIGGHPGQSNYATANMYMNGLAANRRKRGLAGSVLNIGVIYGLGLLQREKAELYAGLEREGYPPISERDIHHMFLEAIVSGKPDTPDQPIDITTGLRRFRWGDANPLHWHLDPRFSHFTLSDGELDSETDLERQRSIKEQISILNDVELVAETIIVAFASRLEGLLQLPMGSVNRHQSISELGIDSLISVEIRNWIWKNVGKDVAVLKILGASSIYRLCLDISGQILAERKQLESAPSLDTSLASRTSSEAI